MIRREKLVSLEASNEYRVIIRAEYARDVYGSHVMSLRGTDHSVYTRIPRGKPRGMGSLADSSGESIMASCVKCTFPSKKYFRHSISGKK
jgi:hypothetical protein